MPSVVKYSIEVDDKGRAVLRDHAKAAEDTGKRVSVAAGHSRDRWNRAMSGFSNQIPKMKISELMQLQQRLQAKFDKKIKLDVSAQSLQATRAQLDVVNRALAGVHQRSSFLERGLTSLGAKALSVFQNMARWATRFIIGGAVASMVALGASIKTAVTNSADFEQMRLRLEQVTGSAAAGTAAYEQLVSFTARTPFQLPGVIEAASTLEAFGASSTRLIKPIGDLAVFMGLSIPEAASAFGRAFAAGAGAADILRERGVLSLIKLQSGVSDLTKLSLPEFRRVMIDVLTDPNGRIAGGTAKLAGTLKGIWSTTKDNIQLMFKGFGDMLASPLKTGLTKINGLFSSLSDIGWDYITKAMVEQWRDTLDVMIRITAYGSEAIIMSLNFIPIFFVKELKKVNIADVFKSWISGGVTEGMIVSLRESLSVVGGTVKNTILASVALAGASIEQPFNEYLDRIKTRAMEIKAGVLASSAVTGKDAGKIIVNNVQARLRASDIELPALRTSYASYKVKMEAIKPPALFSDDWFKQQTTGINSLDLGAFEAKMAELRQIWIDQGAPNADDFSQRFEAIADNYWQHWQAAQAKVVFSSYNAAQAMGQAFSAAAGVIASEFGAMLDKWFGQAKTTFAKIARAMVQAFVSTFARIAARAAGIKVIRWIFQALKPAIAAGRILHQGGPVERYHQGSLVGRSDMSRYRMGYGGGFERLHGGGLKTNERHAILEVDEYVIRRQSVTHETLPWIEHVNRTGKLPAMRPDVYHAGGQVNHYHSGGQVTQVTQSGSTTQASVSFGDTYIQVDGSASDAAVDEIRQLVKANQAALRGQIEDITRRDRRAL